MQAPTASHAAQEIKREAAAENQPNISSATPCAAATANKQVLVDYVFFLSSNVLIRSTPSFLLVCWACWVTKMAPSWVGTVHISSGIKISL
jgi:hypothetical protein